MQVHDVIIIGGGPAGSTAASLLAEKGHKVILFEKEKFPREHVGESLIPTTYAILDRLGVLEELKKIAPRKPGVNFVSFDESKQSLWCFKNVVKDKSYLSFHVVRSAFDKLLLDNSRRKGAEVVEETMVKNVLLESAANPGGVEVHTMGKDGATTVHYGKFLIDASGQSTFLANKLNVKKSYPDLDRVAVFTHWSKTKFDPVLKEGAIKIVYLGGDKKGWIWVIPISTDILSIGVVVNNAYMRQEKDKLQKAGSTDWKQDFYLQEVKSSFMKNEILKDATIDHKVQVIGDYSYYCETKYGDNFAMIGDAGAFLDPIFSSGLYVGMHSAELLTDALHEKFTTGNGEAMHDVFKKINGAVKLLEKFIKLFYSPEVINFSDVANPGELIQFDKTEAMYTIFHYLLSGYFFHDYEKYSEFIDSMRDQKMLAKFQNLISYSKEATKLPVCGETYEEMYGSTSDHEIVFDLEALQ